jgi:hypothetical protein
VLAIEPMINVGKAAVRILDDGWTAVTRDGSLSAHFEHTVTVSSSGPVILTTLDGEMPAQQPGMPVSDPVPEPRVKGRKLRS